MITMFRWVETTSRSCVSMFIWNEFLVGYLLEIQYLLKRDPAYLYIYCYIYICVCISTWYAYPMGMVESNYVGSNARYPGNTLTHQVATKNHKNIFRTVEGMPSCHVLLKSREVCCDWRTTTQTFPAKQLLIQEPEMEHVQMFGKELNSTPHTFHGWYPLKSQDLNL